MGVYNTKHVLLALPYYVSLEPLGNRLPVPDVPRRCWRVLKSPSNRRGDNVTDSAIGITYIFNATEPAVVTTQDTVSVGISYYLISSSLSVVLATVVATRVVVQSKKFRITTGAGGLYRVAVIMLIEPCTLWTANFPCLLEHRDRRAPFNPTNFHQN